MADSVCVALGRVARGIVQAFQGIPVIRVRMLDLTPRGTILLAYRAQTLVVIRCGQHHLGNNRSVRPVHVFRADAACSGFRGVGLR